MKNPRRPKGQGIKKCVCKVCQKIFVARVDRPGFFCTKKCQMIGRKRKPKIINEYKCKECDGLFYARKGRGGTYEYCSKKCRAIGCGKKLAKENHPFWKGGISERTWATKKIINEVKSEIKICQECGQKNNLEGHHIKDYRNHIMLRSLKENIMILCRNCHAKKHPKLKGFIKSEKKRRALDQFSNQKSRGIKKTVENC